MVTPGGIPHSYGLPRFTVRVFRVGNQRNSGPEIEFRLLENFGSVRDTGDSDQE